MSWYGNGLPGRGALQGVSRQPLSKRGKQETTKEVGGKKGRSAFSDLTNRESDVQIADGEKGKFKAGKGQQQENGLERHSLLEEDQQEYFAVADAADDLSDMEFEACSDMPIPALCSPTGHRQWKDIDREDRDNPLACAYYANDIMSALFKAERVRRPLGKYMEIVQHDITAQMRAILVDWMVEVAQEYKLVSETLYLSVSYVDRYLSAVPVQRNQLQLVGVTCMLLASKYEEIYAPQVEEFCFITENTYTREEILATERKVLDALNFELTSPSIRVFLRRFVKAAVASHPEGKPDPRLDLLSSYLAEMTLLEYQFLHFLPSMIAASAVMLAQYCLNGAGWNPTLWHYTSYSARELRPCVTLLHCQFQCIRASELPAIRDKYNSLKSHCVAGMAPPSMLPAALFID